MAIPEDIKDYKVFVKFPWEEGEHNVVVSRADSLNLDYEETLPPYASIPEDSVSNRIGMYHNMGVVPPKVEPSLSLSMELDKKTSNVFWEWVKSFSKNRKYYGLYCTTNKQWYGTVPKRYKKRLEEIARRMRKNGVNIYVKPFWINF